MAVSRWASYFEDALSNYDSVLQYCLEHWIYYQIMYAETRSLVAPPGRILDVGCGLGVTGTYFSTVGYDVTGVDSDPAVLEQAKGLGSEFGQTYTLEVADAFDLSKYHGKFDMALSTGVVEHFDRDVTVELVREQAKCAKYVNVIIPTKHTPTPTDERFYSLSELTQIVRDAGLTPVVRRGFGDVTKTAAQRWFKDLCPPLIYSQIQKRTSFAMDLMVIGRVGE